MKRRRKEETALGVEDGLLDDLSVIDVYGDEDFNGRGKESDLVRDDDDVDDDDDSDSSSSSSESEQE